MTTAEGENTVECEYDWATTPPSQAIIETISIIENVEPDSLLEELDAPLYNSIDPDVLDTFVTADTDITISFTFEQYQIHIDGNTLAVRFD